MTCIHCHEAIHSEDYPKALSYGYRHDGGSLYCTPTPKHVYLAQPEGS